MTSSSSPEIEAIIELLFQPNEEPLFIDGTAPLEDMVREPEAFIKRATDRFGFQVEPSCLKLTIPEFAERVRSQRTRS